jgi:hypothetical protein
MDFERGSGRAVADRRRNAIGITVTVDLTYGIT